MKKTLSAIAFAAFLAGCSSVDSSSDPSSKSDPKQSYLIEKPFSAEVKRSSKEDKERGVFTQPTYAFEVIKYPTPQNVKGNKIGQISQENFQWGLEGIIINGVPFWPEHNPNSKDNELPFVLRKYAESSEAPNPPGDKGPFFELESDFVYIPTIYLKPTGEALKEIHLAKDGRFGVKVKRTKLDTDGIGAGIVRLTQDDVRWKALIRTIGDYGHFFTPENDLSFTPIVGPLPAGIVVPAYDKTALMIPVEGTTPVTHPESHPYHISLRNPERIYGLVKTPVSEYNERTNMSAESKQASGRAIEAK